MRKCVSERYKNLEASILSIALRPTANYVVILWRNVQIIMYLELLIKIIKKILSVHKGKFQEKFK
jgi:hypothetical protein